MANAVRVDPLTKECPEGTVNCNSYISPENTICVTQEQKDNNLCPITSFELISVADYNLYNLGVNSESVYGISILNNHEITEGYYLSTSKEIDQMPVGSIKVESAPCRNPDRISTDIYPDLDKLDFSNDDTMASTRDIIPNYYPTEVERYTVGCLLDDMVTLDYLDLDMRY